MPSKRITFVTSNANKLKEVRLILGENFPYELVYLKIDLDEFQGEMEEICVKKAQAAYDIIKAPCLVEDSSLCFNALDGLPGPYVKWFEQKLGVDGLCKLLDGFEDKSAQAVCTFGFHPGDSGSDVITFQGRTDGVIVNPKGEAKFGWDSCFQPLGYDKTYAEFSTEEKNKISHRYWGLHFFQQYVLQFS